MVCNVCGASTASQWVEYDTLMGRVIFCDTCYDRRKSVCSVCGMEYYRPQFYRGDICPECKHAEGHRSVTYLPRGKFVCQVTGRIEYIGFSFYADGYLASRSCMDAYFDRCSCCRQYRYETDLVQLSRNRKICVHCLYRIPDDESFTTCHICGTRIRYGSPIILCSEMGEVCVSVVNDKIVTVCVSCRDASFRYCLTCHQYVYGDGMAVDGGYICNRCRRDVATVTCALCGVIMIADSSSHHKKTVHGTTYDLCPTCNSSGRWHTLRRIYPNPPDATRYKCEYCGNDLVNDRIYYNGGLFCTECAWNFIQCSITGYACPKAYNTIQERCNPCMVDNLETRVIRCRDCGKYIRLSSPTYVDSFNMLGEAYVATDGGMLCNDCAGKHAFTCQSCGTRILGPHEVVNGEKWCRDCELCYSVTCYHCGRKFSRDNIMVFQNCYVCRECVATRTVVCGICGVEDTISTMARLDSNLVCARCYYDICASCEDCGSVFIASNDNYIDGHIICDNCQHRHISQCIICGEYHYIPYMTVAYNSPGIYICSHCLPMTVLCGECNAVIPGRAAQEVDGVILCNTCIRNDCVECMACRRFMRRRDAIQMNRESFVCESCMEAGVTLKSYRCSICGRTLRLVDMYRIDENSVCLRCHLLDDRVINGYSYKPRPEFKGKGPLYLGIELEVEVCDSSPTRVAAGVLSADHRGILYIKRDGSLDNGFEIVSHPCSLDYHRKCNWDAVFMVLNEHCIPDADTAGLHVHASVAFLSDLDRVKLSAFMWKNHKHIEKLARRQSNRYCYKIGDNAFKNRLSESIHDRKDKKRWSWHSDERYEGLNWTNRHTVEFRYFKTTLEKYILLATLEFVDAVMRFIKTRGVKSLLSDNSWVEFTQYVIDNKYKCLQYYLESLQA